MTKESIFQGARAKSGPRERAAFLDDACAGQPDLRAAVEAMLAAPEPVQSRQDKPTVTDQPDTAEHVPAPEDTQATSAYHPDPSDPPSETYPGAVIAGRYTLETKLGEGGMGEVWVASQSEPVKRQVALKVIKKGMDSRAVLARFEAERQALALMDHPNIARVFDGGVTPTGQPFFVMELVAGQPLTRFCDEARLSVRQRLDLFVPTCQAVQHAHQKGIIHRDLKPANILVTVVDGRPTPKVIDFGVAKATGGKLTDDTLATQAGAVIGTLEYMAPEQTGLNLEDIDTRADIYSLGVILYELLTGLRPFDSRRLKKAALDEVVRVIRHEEPPSLASRLAADQSLPSAATARQSEPRQLLKLVRGELDWIVQKCLEKDRSRRFETASALARDVQRYLSDEPVEARPAAAGYRFRKFVRRNKVPVVAAGVVALSLIAGMIGTTWGLVRADAALRDAEAARREAETAALAEKQANDQAVREKVIAEGARNIAERVKDLLVRSLRRADPDQDGNRATIADALAQTAAALDAAKDVEPRVAAELRQTVGMTYLGLGMDKEAEQLFAAAAEEFARTCGPDAPETLSAEAALAQAMVHGGKLAGGLERARHSVAAIAARQGPTHLDTLAAKTRLAFVLRDAGQLEEATELAAEALQAFTASEGAKSERALEAAEALATSLSAAGRHAEAAAMLHRVVADEEAQLGADNPTTLTTRGALIVALGQLGPKEKQEGAELAARNLKLAENRFGPESPNVGFFRKEYATAIIDQRPAEAVGLLRDWLKTREPRLGPSNASILATRNNLATALQRLGRRDEAITELELLLPAVRSALGPGNLRALLVGANLAALYLDAGRPSEAEPLADAYVAGMRGALPPAAPALAPPLGLQGRVRLRLGKSVEAEQALRECVEARKNAKAPPWMIAQTEGLLGQALAGQKKFTEAEPLLIAAHKALVGQDLLPHQRYMLPEAVQGLVGLYEACGRKDQADAWRKKLPPLDKAPGP